MSWAFDNNTTQEPCPRCRRKLVWAWAAGRKYLKCSWPSCKWKSRRTEVERRGFTVPWEETWNFRTVEDA